MRVLIILIVLLVIGWLFDQIGVYLERKGLLYYRKQKPPKGILGSALLELNAQLMPSNRHVVVAKQEKRAHRQVVDESDKGHFMQISFQQLKETDFSLLLKWLEQPLVKAWWDQEMDWTLDLIREKYGSYKEGYKLEKGLKKTILACIIHVDEVPVGYIQLYNAHDFPRTAPLAHLPENLAAFDLFIGEEDYRNKGVGSKAIDQFLNTYATSYTHVFADPDKSNLAAIRAYEKAGFNAIATQPIERELWMIRLNRSMDNVV